MYSCHHMTAVSTLPATASHGWNAPPLSILTSTCSSRPQTRYACDRWQQRRPNNWCHFWLSVMPFFSVTFASDSAAFGVEPWCTWMDVIVNLVGWCKAVSSTAEDGVCSVVFGACVCVCTCDTAFGSMLSCVNRRERLWICMEFCGGGSMQDICHGTNFQYFARKFVVFICRTIASLTTDLQCRSYALYLYDDRISFLVLSIVCNIASSSVLWHCWLGGRKGIRPVKNGGWWRLALVGPDGVAPSRMVCVSASINLPLHHKSPEVLFWHWLTPVVPEKGL